MKLVFACLASLIVFLWFPTLALAGDVKLPDVSEGQIQEAEGRIVPLRFLPSHPLYFTISLKELIERIFQPSSAKRAKFDSILAGKRLKEAYLLVVANKVSLSSDALGRYSDSITKMSDNLIKARSQNQDVVPLVSQIADAFGSHEVLFSAIEKKSAGLRTSEFDANLKAAVQSFVEALFTINNIKPGLKDRFKMASSSAAIEKVESSSSAVSEPSTPLPSFIPRRIIY